MLAGCTIPKSHHIRGVSPSFGNKKHGTRETGDRRRSSMICNRFCHPFHGFQLPFLFLRGVSHPTLPRGVLHRLAMGMSPVSRALNSTRLRLAKFQFIEHLSQTLGHVVCAQFPRSSSIPKVAERLAESSSTLFSGGLSSWAGSMPRRVKSRAGSASMRQPAA